MSVVILQQWSLLLTWWAASEEKCSIGLAGRFVFSFAGGGEPGPPATAQFGQQIALPILKRLFRIVLRTLGPHSPLPTDSPLLSWSADAEGLQAVYELRLLCSDLTKTLDMDETFASCINKSGYWLTTIAFWTSILRQVWPCAAAGRVDAVIHAQSQRDSLKLVMEFFTFRFFGKVQQCLLQMCVVALGSGSSHPASPKRTSGGTSRHCCFSRVPAVSAYKQLWPREQARCSAALLQALEHRPAQQRRRLMLKPWSICGCELLGCCSQPLEYKPRGGKKTSGGQKKAAPLPASIIIIIVIICFFLRITSVQPC